VRIKHTHTTQALDFEKDWPSSWGFTSSHQCCSALMSYTTTPDEERTA